MAASPTRNTGELVKGWSPGPVLRHGRLVALRARYRFRGIRMISRSPTSSPLVSCLILSMNRSIEAATVGKVGAEPPAIELCGHRRVVLGGDVDDARDVGEAIVVAGAGDRRNELVLRVPLVLVVLAKLVAVVRLPVQECDDDRVLEANVDGVGSLNHRTGARYQVITQQRPGTRAIDQGIPRLQQRQRGVRPS